ncbi:MAG TPA: hypothetical protein VJT75_06290 [Thermoleophilaceae bacterium]|nr:hypothetical protein [Thermoleophilaceae bacterium]
MRRVLGAAALLGCVALNARTPPEWSDSASSVRLGEKLLHGDLDGFTGIGQLVHTPHPGAILAATPLGLLGHHGALVAYGVLSGVAFATLVYAAFRLGRLLGGTLVAGFLAAAMAAFPPHVVSAVRDTVDVPFAALVLVAAVAAVQGRPRATLLALTAAGTLRPEAWALAVCCAFVWRGRLRWELALPLAAPGVWLLFGLATTGDPMVALHTTRTYNAGGSVGVPNPFLMMAGMSTVPVVMVGVVGAIAAVRKRDPRRMALAGFAVVLAAATCAECVVGDLVPFDRFLLPSSALLAVLGAVATVELVRSRAGERGKLGWLGGGRVVAGR